MEIILKPRGRGKTFDLVRVSAENKIPILSSFPQHVLDAANELGLTIPEPISLGSVLRGRKMNVEQVYVDDADIALSRLLGCHVAGITISYNDDPCFERKK